MPKYGPKWIGKRRFSLICLAIFVFVMVMGNLLPWSYRVERSIEIDAPVSVVFSLTNDLKNWERWHYLYNGDPTLKQKFTQNTSGTGARLRWKNQLTSGHIEITDSEENDDILVEHDYAGELRKSMFEVEYRGVHSCALTWQMEGRVTSTIINGYIARQREIDLGRALDKALEFVRIAAETDGTLQLIEPVN